MSSASATKPSAVSYISLGVITVQVNGDVKPNYWLLAYYIVCILLTANLCAWLWGRGQTVASMAIVPMLLLVFIFFGLRCFLPTVTPPTSSCPDKNQAAGLINVPPFPPIVNMCPDFMTAWTDSRNNKVYCYDTNNTYNMKTYNDAGLQSGLTINGLGGQSAYLLFDPAQNINSTDPSTDTGGLRWPLYYLLDNNLKKITGDTNGRYLTWEGILEPTGSLYGAWKQNMYRVLPGITA